MHYNIRIDYETKSGIEDYSNTTWHRKEYMEKSFKKYFTIYTGKYLSGSLKSFNIIVTRVTRKNKTEIIKRGSDVFKLLEK